MFIQLDYGLFEFFKPKGLNFNFAKMKQNLGNDGVQEKYVLKSRAEIFVIIQFL